MDRLVGHISGYIYILSYIEGISHPDPPSRAGVRDDPAHQEGQVPRHHRRGRGHLAAPAGTLALILTLPTTHFTHTYILHNILIKSFEKSMNVCVYVYVLQTYIAYIHTYIHTRTYKVSLV